MPSSGPCGRGHLPGYPDRSKEPAVSEHAVSGRALAALPFVGEMGIHPVGTDGNVLYYQPEELMELFKKGTEKVNRVYLHSLLHCIFLHVFPERDSEGNPAVDVQYWNLACDIAWRT